VSILARLLNVVLPAGGNVVLLHEAYFDESGTHENSPVLCVGGYIIEKEACERLDDSWLQMLNKFNLPFFRMSACAQGVDPFDKLPMPQRIKAETEAIAIIRREITLGIAVTVDPKIYEEIIPKIPELGDAYSFCAHTCLTAVKSWARESNYKGDIAYFFESGHKSQSEANQIMQNIFKIPELRQQHRYLSHSFVDKEKVRPVQAADMIAWHWQKDHKRRDEGVRPDPRKDTRALLAEDPTGKPTYRTMHWNRFMLESMADNHLRRHFPVTYVRHQ
jgi:hypothetical protein